MSGKYLLDTNIIIALFAAKASVIQHLQGTDEIFIPSVAVGELYYGAHKSHRREENLARIADFVARNAILSCDAETAHHYGKLKDGLRQKGRPIPENDLWIAAIAIQHNLVLVSRDAHLAAVSGLEFESW